MSASDLIARLGADVVTMSTGEFGAMIRQQLADNAKLVRAAGIKPN